ncbi:MAG: four helix bundle protein [Anaerolineales bacterium]
MARYEHLPIYKQAMDLTIYCEQIVRNFSRYHKYTLGSELRQKSRAVVELIIKANSTVERLALLELRERLEGLKVLIWICKAVKAFSGGSVRVRTVHLTRP